MRSFIKHGRLLKTTLISMALSAMLYPVTSFAGPMNYGFKIVGHPSDTTVSVEVVDRGTQQPVANAQLYTVRWVYGVGKGVQPRQVRIPLKPSGDGTFTIAGKPGDELRLAAVVPGINDPVSGSVFVGS